MAEQASVSLTWSRTSETGISLDMVIIGPRREKTCLRGVRQSDFQTSLLSYRD